MHVPRCISADSRRTLKAIVVRGHIQLLLQCCLSSQKVLASAVYAACMLVLTATPPHSQREVAESYIEAHMRAPLPMAKTVPQRNIASFRNVLLACKQWEKDALPGNF